MSKLKRLPRKLILLVVAIRSERQELPSNGKKNKKMSGQIATILAEYHISQAQLPPVAPPTQPPIAVPIIASTSSTVSAMTAHDATVNKLQSILRRG